MIRERESGMVTSRVRERGFPRLRRGSRQRDSAKGRRPPRVFLKRWVWRGTRIGADDSGLDNRLNPNRYQRRRFHQNGDRNLIGDRSACLDPLPLGNRCGDPCFALAARRNLRNRRFNSLGRVTVGTATARRVRKRDRRHASRHGGFPLGTARHPAHRHRHGIAMRHDAYRLARPRRNHADD